LELLAARTLLGQQLDIPHIQLRKPPSSLDSSQYPSANTLNRPFLSNSNTRSLSNLLSKKHFSHTDSSSQSTRASHVRPRASSAAAAHHSRTTSWSRKIAGRRGPTAADRSLRIIPPSWPNSNGGPLSSEISPNILVLDAVQLASNSLSNDQHQLVPSTSPTPSSSSGYGIAVSNPPFPENNLDKDLEQLHMRDHPYAQSHGRYLYPFSQPQKLDANANASEIVTRHQHSPSRSSDFAGPHPSIPAAVSIPTLASSNYPVNDIVMRHRLPPQVLLQSTAYLHPYDIGVTSHQGAHSDDNNITAVYPPAHPKSSIPPLTKMFAELSTPGNVDEVLPQDIQYSPNVSASTRKSAFGLSVDPSASPSIRNLDQLRRVAAEPNHAYALSDQDSRRNTRLGMDDVLEYTLLRNEGPGRETHGWASFSPVSRVTNKDVLLPNLHSKSDPDPDFIDDGILQTGTSHTVVCMGPEALASLQRPTQVLASTPNDVPHASFKRLRSEVSDNSGSTSHSGSIPSTQFLLHPLDESHGLDRFDGLFVQPEDGYPDNNTIDSEPANFAQIVMSPQELSGAFSLNGSSIEEGAVLAQDSIHVTAQDSERDAEEYPIALSISHSNDGEHQDDTPGRPVVPHHRLNYQKFSFIVVCQIGTKNMPKNATVDPGSKITTIAHLKGAKLL
jgi:hypothetical protein